MKTISKSLASTTAAYAAVEGGSQCPARVRYQGAMMPIEKVIDIHPINIQSLVCLFTCKEAMGKNVN